MKYITIRLTEDQARFVLDNLYDAIDLGDELLGTKSDKSWNAFIKRIQDKLRKAMQISYKTE